MPRPVKLRQVDSIPTATFFKPAGVPMAQLETVTLAVEEVEAIRLKDEEGLHQEDCATQMRVSRATFHTILKSARQKIADALLNGKAIQVQGGVFALPGGRFRCRRDGSEWHLPPGPLPGVHSVSCPTCRGTAVQPVAVPHAPWCSGRVRARKGYGWQGPGGPQSQGHQPDKPRARRRSAAQAADASSATSRQTQEHAGMDASATDQTTSRDPERPAE